MHSSSDAPSRSVIRWREVSSARSAGSNTDQGIFAIKQSLESWSIAEAEISSAYHRLCWEAGIPTPEPEAKGPEEGR